MKLALVADIHSNAEALEAVLAAVKSAQADCLMVAGDLVGYYFEPARTLKLLSNWDKPLYAVRGNHEEMLRAAMKSGDTLERITKKYGPGICIALEQLSATEVDWLVNLPHPLQVNAFGFPLLLCHGSPLDLNQYLYPDTPLSQCMPASDVMPSVCVTGHTHYPMRRDESGYIVINPGSVGQPRNRVPGAHWALLDTDTRWLDFFVEPYDIGNLQSKCRALAPAHSYLWEVLTRS